MQESDDLDDVRAEADDVRAAEDWEDIAATLPAIGRLEYPMLTNVDAEMNCIYKSGSYQELVAGIGYLDLRFRYYRHLEAHNGNMRHINEYEAYSCEAWANKFNDKAKLVKRAKRGPRGALIKERLPKEVSHPWLH